MIQLKNGIHNIEDYLRELGFPYIEKEVKVGPYRIDMMAYSINRGNLQPGVIVELKTQKDVFQVQQQFSRYVNYIENSCDALLVTDKGMVWLDIKSGLPKEKPNRKKSTTFIDNQDDIFKILLNMYRNLPNELSNEKKITIIQRILLLRSYLFEISEHKEEFITQWNKVFSENLWTEVLVSSYKMFQIVGDKQEELVEFKYLEWIYQKANFIHPQTPSLGRAYMKLHRQVSSKHYPPFVKKLIEGLLETFTTKELNHKNYLLWNYDTLFIPAKKINGMNITTINNENNKEIVNFLASISGLNHSHHFLLDSSNKQMDENYHYCILDTVSTSYSSIEVTNIIKCATSYLKEDGFLFVLVAESYFNEKNSLKAFEDTDNSAIKAVINLPEHIYRPISSKLCKLVVFQKSNKSISNYLTQDIYSLEKDIPKTIKQFRKWIKSENKEECSYSLESIQTKTESNFYIKKDFSLYEKSNTYLEDFISINPESIKVNSEDYYRYLDIQSIDKQGRITSCKTLRGKEIPTRSRYIVREGDIILSLLRPGGNTDFDYVGYISERYDGALTNSNLCVIRPKKIDSKLLYLYFRNSHFSKKLRTLWVGNIPRITLSSIKEIAITKNIPKDKTKTAKELFEELIANSEKTNENFVENIFNRLFVKSSKVYNYYYLGHISAINSGTRFNFKETYRFEEIKNNNLDNFRPYVRSKNINSDNIFFEKQNIEWITNEITISEKNRAKYGDILVNKTTSLLKDSSLAKFDDQSEIEFIPNQHIYIIHPSKASGIEHLYLLAYLKSSYAQSQIKKDIKRLSMKDLRNLLIPVPKVEIQQEIAKELEEFSANKKQLENKIDEFILELKGQ